MIAQGFGQAPGKECQSVPECNHKRNMYLLGQKHLGDIVNACQRQLLMWWGVQGAALKLAYMEYADLALEERLALLQGLLEQALDCEVVRELITSKVEAMALPRQKKPVCCSAP